MSGFLALWDHYSALVCSCIAAELKITAQSSGRWGSGDPMGMCRKRQATDLELGIRVSRSKEGHEYALLFSIAVQGERETVGRPRT